MSSSSPTGPAFGASPRVPARSLPALIRRSFDKQADAVRVIVGKVTSVASSSRLVVDAGGGQTFSAAKLSSYAAPAVGDTVYVLSAGGYTIILGTVK